MEIIIRKYEYDWGSRKGLEIESGDITLEFHDGEPEDATLWRDFSDCYRITDLVKRAHEAGLAGESLSIREEKPEE